MTSRPVQTSQAQPGCTYAAGLDNAGELLDLWVFPAPGSGNLWEINNLGQSYMDTLIL